MLEIKENKKKKSISLPIQIVIPLRQTGNLPFPFARLAFTEICLSEHTVDCLQTIGVCNQSTVSLSTNNLMFFSINPMFFKNNLMI